MAEVEALFQNANAENCPSQMSSYHVAQGKLTRDQQAISIDQQAVDSTRNDFATCLGITGKVAIAAARPDINAYMTDAAATQAMCKTLLAQLKKDVETNSALEAVSDIAKEQTDTMKAEIETLKAEIRKERRLFLDADPSAPTSTAGLYYTKEPDNQLLIAFIICFCVLLAVLTALLLLNHIPIKYLTDLSMNERLKIAGILWAVSLLVTYVGFFTFT